MEILFYDKEHEKFYNNTLKKMRNEDVYHKALCYTLGISGSVRENFKNIYDLKTGCVKTECLHDAWQTGTTLKICRLAFALYCNGTPSIKDYDKVEEQLEECRRYSAGELFCCEYSLYFLEAIKIRYPECLKGCY